MKHLMVDLETLGQRPGCGITEVAWGLFNDFVITPKEGYDIKELLIHPEQSLLYGFDIDPETIKWWIEKMQGLPAGRNSSRPNATFPQILAELASQWDEHWYAGVRNVWCKGLDFDIPILKAAFDRLGVERPILLREQNFRNWRCFRTLKATSDFESTSKNFFVSAASVASDIPPHVARLDVEAQIGLAESFFEAKRNRDARANKAFGLEIQLDNATKALKVALEANAKQAKLLEKAKRAAKNSRRTR
jgi:hypothetical protein